MTPTFQTFYKSLISAARGLDWTRDTKKTLPLPNSAWAELRALHTATTKTAGTHTPAEIRAMHIETFLPHTLAEIRAIHIATSLRGSDLLDLAENPHFALVSPGAFSKAELVDIRAIMQVKAIRISDKIQSLKRDDPADKKIPEFQEMAANYWQISEKADFMLSQTPKGKTP